MKRTIGFSLIFLFAFFENAEAQSGFMDHHYTWTEYYAWGWSSHRGTERNTFDSMVVEIDGKFYQERLTSNSPTGDDWGHTQFFYRADTTGKVYLSYFGFENLMYDYSLQVNDTFGFQVVDQIDSINLLNGGKRKRLTLRCIYDENPPTDFGYTYWIEGLGGSHGLYNIYSSECGFDGDEYTTLCIVRNDTLLYDEPEYDSCWYLAVRTPNIEVDYVFIFPNPASSFISISIKDHQIQNIFVIDLLGNRTFLVDSSPFDISFLPTGYYFLQIELENKQVMMKSFVKQ